MHDSLPCRLTEARYMFFNIPYPFNQAKRKPNKLLARKFIFLSRVQPGFFTRSIRFCRTRLFEFGKKHKSENPKISRVHLYEPRMLKSTIFSRNTLFLQFLLSSNNFFPFLFPKKISLNEKLILLVYNFILSAINLSGWHRDTWFFIKTKPVRPRVKKPHREKNLSKKKIFQSNKFFLRN